MFFNCIYSFKRGKLPFKSIYVGNISNSTYRSELSMKFYDNSQRVLTEYGNITLSDSLKADAVLNAEISEYSRTPDTYDSSGNIGTYIYRITVNYKVKGEEQRVSTSKILKGDIEENDGMDSVAVENIRNLIDRLMVEF